jgi:hypothetical protein
MALKFRRGSTADKSGSLSFGEPYVNSTLGTLQVGGIGGDITLSPQIDSSSNVVVNSLSASSFVSASNLHITNNAEIKGNLVLGGNITIGDQTSDTVAVNANLSSSLIPSQTNVFDLGSVTNAWRDLYISTGSIKIVNPGTNTVVGTLTSNASGDFKVSGEVSGSTIAGLGNAQQYSASVNSRLDSIQTTTASLNGRVAAIETKTGSLEQSFHTYSSSLNIYTASNDSTNVTQNSRLTAIEATTASLNTYTASNDATNTTQNNKLGSLESVSSSLLTFSSSVANAIEFTGSSVTLKGDLLVKGTTTSINSTTVDIGDNIISLNGTGATNGGIIVRDATGGTTTSGSLLWDTTNDYWKAGAAGNEDRLVLANEFNTYTSSNNTTNTSQNGRLDGLESFSASVNSTTASQQIAQNAQNVRLNTLENTTASLNTYTASNDSTNNTQNNRLNSLETASGSIRNDFNSFTSSTAGVNATQSLQLTALETASGSLNSYTASQDSRNTALFTATSSLNDYTASNTTNINAIHTSTASLNSFSASVIATGSVINTFTSSVNTSTSSLNSFTASINTTIKTKLDAEGVISGSSQILSGTTIHSGSFFNGISVVSGSSQIDHNQTTNYSANKHIDHTSVSITAGAGLTGGGDISSTRTLDIGAGDGITVNANDVAVDSTVVRTSGNQTIGGTKTFSGDVIINGTGSFSYIQSTTGSAKIIGDAFVVVNANTPSSRYAGLSVYDSGSNTTASLFFDGEANDWSYEYSSSEGVDYGAIIFHPEYTTKGSPTYLANGYLPMGSGTHHLANSTIYDNGVGIGLGRNVVITGSIVASGTTLVSGSSQIDVASTTGDIVLGTRTSGNYVASLVAGTNITLSNNSGEGATPTIGLTNNSITIAGNATSLGGSISAVTILSGTGVFSGSAQITTLPSVDTDDLVEGVTNKYYTDTRVKTKLNADNVLSGSSQVFSGISGDVLIASNGVATIQANSVALGSDTTGDYVASLVAGTNITLSNNSGEGATPTIGLTNNSITIAGQSTSLGGTITAATIGNAIGAFSGSSQVAHNSTTGYEANRHIDHSAVSISAGTGLTGGGDITTTRTLSIDSTVATLTGAQVLTNKTISGTSNTLSNIGNGSLTNSSVTVTAGTGLSGGGAVSLGGSVTLSNAGVTSNVAGTGVSVSGATGAVTISIGQSVATSATVTFDKVITGNNGNAENVRIGDDAWFGDVNVANTIRLKGVQDATAGYLTFGNQATQLGLTNSTTLTWGASFTATGDVTAYSDARVKENVKTIENPLDKVLKLRGVTYNRIDLDDKTEKIGVIAQEIQQVLPQVVIEENDRLSVSYGNITALLIEGMKEQQQQIHKLTLEIENLKKQKGL